MLPRQDMNRHLFTKEEEGEEERKGGKDRLTVEMDHKYLDSRKGDVCEKGTTPGRSWVNSKSDKHKFWIPRFGKNNLPSDKQEIKSW